MCDISKPFIHSPLYPMFILSIETKNIKGVLILSFRNPWDTYANILDILCLSGIRFRSPNPFENFRTRKSKPWTH